MRRDIEEELIESDEGELIEQTALEEELVADDTEVNLSKRDLSSELASVWSAPVTRSRLRAQAKSLQDLLKTVELESKGEVQDKPACWFNLISM
ncbi:hypothetical protein Bca4012_026404 [Brassica carinata]